MESNAILVINLALIAGLMTALWLISLRIRNASIVDVFWGLGFVLVSWTTVLLTDTTAMRRWVIVATATFWGTRLAAYLAWRNLGKPEDYRYGAMRDRYGDRFAWVSALLVFGLQGMLMWIVSWPLQFGQQSAAASTGWTCSVSCCGLSAGCSRRWGTGNWPGSNGSRNMPGR